MKTKDIYNDVLVITKEFINNIGIDRINDYKDALKKSNEYKDFNVRFANDVVKYGAIYHIKNPVWLCDKIDDLRLNDTHLTTLFLKVCKDLNLL